MNLFLGNQHRVRSSEGLLLALLKLLQCILAKLSKGTSRKRKRSRFYHNHPSGVAERDPFARCRLCLGNIPIH